MSFYDLSKDKRAELVEKTVAVHERYKFFFVLIQDEAIANIEKHYSQ